MSKICNFQVYREAAERLQRDGWTQGTASRGARACGWQALIDAAAKFGIELTWREPATSPILTEVHEYLMARRPSYGRIWADKWNPERRPAVGDFVEWNDARGRDAKQVISAFEQLADKLELEWRRDELPKLLARICELQAEVRRLKAENARLHQRIASWIRGGRSAVDVELGTIEQELDQLLAVEAQVVKAS